MDHISPITLEKGQLNRVATSRVLLLIWGYIREQRKKMKVHVPPEIVRMIIMYFPSIQWESNVVGIIGASSTMFEHQLFAPIIAIKYTFDGHCLALCGCKLEGTDTMHSTKSGSSNKGETKTVEFDGYINRLIVYNDSDQGMVTGLILVSCQNTVYVLGKQNGVTAFGITPPDGNYAMSGFKGKCEKEHDGGVNPIFVTSFQH